MNTLLFAILAFLTGGIWGSFLGVVAVRIPQGLSLAFPASRCDRCLSPLSPSELIPFFSWIHARGHCRHCHSPILFEIPASELLTGAYFLCIALIPAPLHEKGLLLLFFSFALPLTLIDLRHHRLPHLLTLSGTASAVLLSLLTMGVKGFLLALAGVILGFLPIAILAFFYPKGIGLGDAFWLGAIGAFTGPQRLSIVLMVASLTGIIAMIAVHLASDRENRTSILERPLPFGPFLSLGGILALAFPGLAQMMNSLLMGIRL